MKSYLPQTLLALLAVACINRSEAVTTINWGSPVDSVLKDSYGNTLGAGYSFELGTFAGTFVPTDANYAEWEANWRVFDRAEYNVTDGYFTGTAELLADGSSSSPDADFFDFSERNAYLWVFNQQEAVLWSSQWLLVRDSTWVFPVKAADCCPTSLPLEWSISDLATSQESPVFGGQDGNSGGGTSFDSGSYSLQTYSLVPEVGAVPVMIGVVLLTGFHRRRGRK